MAVDVNLASRCPICCQAKTRLLSRGKRSYSRTGRNVLLIDIETDGSGRPREGVRATRSCWPRYTDRVLPHLASVNLKHTYTQNYGRQTLLRLPLVGFIMPVSILGARRSHNGFRVYAEILHCSSPDRIARCDIRYFASRGNEHLPILVNPTSCLPGYVVGTRLQSLRARVADCPPKNHLCLLLRVASAIACDSRDEHYMYFGPDCNAQCMPHPMSADSCALLFRAQDDGAISTDSVEHACACAYSLR